MLIEQFMRTDPFRLMDEALHEALTPTPRRRVRRSPLTDHGEHFEFVVTLPGVAPEAVELTAGADFLKIVATRKLDVPEGYVVRQRERVRSDFSHDIRLPSTVDTTKVEAKLEDGLLTVKLPKLAAAKPRTITVSAA